jgi:thymidylate synthase ThyX
MPTNDRVRDIQLPVSLKRGEYPGTRFKEQLGAIKVRLMQAPTLEELLAYIPEFATATWQDRPYLRSEISDKERARILVDVFSGKILPTALETINLTFEIDGLDYVDVTHILRHRMFSFSAQCTADRDMRRDDVVVKNAIMADQEFYDRYVEITVAAKNLYADMVDSNRISILDARTILTRNIETFYYIRGTLKDWLMFIEQRLDEQIQPTSDNVIAMYVYREIARQYPPLAGRFTIGGMDSWYVKTAPTGRSSNIYPPKPANDVFDHKPEWFLYGDKRREDFQGYETYLEIRDAVANEISEIGGYYESYSRETD